MDVPRFHGRGFTLIGGAIEDSAGVRSAHVLGTRAIDADQLHWCAATIHDHVAGNVQPGHLAAAATTTASSRRVGRRWDGCARWHAGVGRCAGGRAGAHRDTGWGTGVGSWHRGWRTGAARRIGGRRTGAGSWHRGWRLGVGWGTGRRAGVVDRWYASWRTGRSTGRGPTYADRTRGVVPRVLDIPIRREDPHLDRVRPEGGTCWHGPRDLVVDGLAGVEPLTVVRALKPFGAVGIIDLDVNGRRGRRCSVGHNRGDRRGPTARDRCRCNVRTCAEVGVVGLRRSAGTDRQTGHSKHQNGAQSDKRKRNLHASYPTFA